jgi:hypothetical protein
MRDINTATDPHAVALEHVMEEPLQPLVDRRSACRKQDAVDTKADLQVWAQPPPQMLPD